MKIVYCFLFLSLLAACKSSVSPEQQAVDTATESYKKQPSDSTAAAVVHAIDTYIKTYGLSDSISAGYLLKGARISTDHNRLQEALEYYKTYILAYPDRPDQAARLLEVINVTEKLQQPELNQVVYKSFVTRFPKDSKTASLESKIENKDITTDSLLRYLGVNIFNDTIFRLNEARSRVYIQACELAVMGDPSLPGAPEFLHRAAETARTLRDIPKAIDLYDWIIEQYPTHSRAATSLFLKAFTYDNDLRDYTKAGELYNDFLARYPDNEFAESAKFLLDNLGVSEEELRKILERKNKENVQ
jgi:TolA-binding protein